MRVFGNRLLSKIFGHKMEVVYIRDWRRLQNEYLCHVLLNKYYSGHEFKKDKQAVYVARMGLRKGYRPDGKRQPGRLRRG
jgi:hypothetical protein